MKLKHSRCQVTHRTNLPKLGFSSSSQQQRSERYWFFLFSSVLWWNLVLQPRCHLVATHVLPCDHGSVTSLDSFVVFFSFALSLHKPRLPSWLFQAETLKPSEAQRTGSTVFTLTLVSGVFSLLAKVSVYTGLVARTLNYLCSSGSGWCLFLSVCVCVCAGWRGVLSSAYLISFCFSGCRRRSVQHRPDNETSVNPLASWTLLNPDYTLSRWQCHWLFVGQRLVPLPSFKALRPSRATPRWMNQGLN